jgi:hypothetical protein
LPEPDTTGKVLREKRDNKPEEIDVPPEPECRGLSLELYRWSHP